MKKQKKYFNRLPCTFVLSFNWLPLMTFSIAIQNVYSLKVSKGAKIRNRYNQVPHLAKGTNGKVTNSQLDTTNESQKVSSFPADDHKAHITDAHKGIANTR